MPYGHKIATENILGVKIDIHVTSGGKFQANVPGDDDGDTLQADSLAGLKELVRKRIQQLKSNVLIPVTLFNWGGKMDRWERGVTRGLVDCLFRGTNVRTGDFLMQDAAGKKFSVDDYMGSKRLARRFTPEQAARYQVLTKAADDAAEALRVFEDEVLVSPKDLLAQVEAEVDAGSADS